MRACVLFATDDILTSNASCQAIYRENAVRDLCPIQHVRSTDMMMLNRLIQSIYQDLDHYNPSQPT